MDVVVNHSDRRSSSDFSAMLLIFSTMEKKQTCCLAMEARDPVANMEKIQGKQCGISSINKES